MIRDPENHDPKFRIVYESVKGKRVVNLHADDELYAYYLARAGRMDGESVKTVRRVESPCRIYNMDREMFVKRNRYFDKWFSTEDEAKRYIRDFELDPLVFVVV